MQRSRGVSRGALQGVTPLNPKAQPCWKPPLQAFIMDISNLFPFFPSVTLVILLMATTYYVALSLYYYDSIRGGSHRVEDKL